MKAAVICSGGIGDGLIMMVASHRLFSRGYEVTTYQDLLEELHAYFPNHKFKKRSLLINIKKELSSYDLIILQNDNSSLSYQIIHLYKKGELHNLSVFYSSYEKEKHGTLTSWDRVFNRNYPMVENIAKAVASLLQCTQISKNNGLIIPKGLKKHRFPHRVLIHPTSTSLKRTWHSYKFLKLAQKIEKRGYQVSFCVSPKEYPHWKSLLQDHFSLPYFKTLDKLAAYIFESAFLIDNESGPGHLASNLHIPTLIIASCRKQMHLWRPSWFMTTIITPPSFIPNIKRFRWRENYWQSCISVGRVLKALKSMEQKIFK